MTIEMNDIHAEQVVIIQALYSSQHRTDLFDKIHKDDFAFPEHVTTWHIMRELEYSRENPWSAPHLIDELRRDSATILDFIRPVLEAAGSFFDETELSWAIDKVKNLSIKRQAHDISLGFAKRMLHNENPVDLISDLQIALSSLASKKKDHIIPSAADIVRSFGDDCISSDAVFMPSGFRQLDEMIGGFSLGGITLIAGDSGSGKTSFLCDLILKQLEANVPIGVLSLEVVDKTLTSKILAMKASIPPAKALKKVRTPQGTWTHALLPHEINRLRKARDETPLKLLRVDDRCVDSSQIRNRLVSMQAQFGVKIVFVDYITLIESRSDGSYEKANAASLSLKNAARELGIAIVALSQINRRHEERSSKEPRKSDVRDSHQIVQDADVLAFLQRNDEDSKGNQTFSGRGQSTLWIKKNRHLGSLSSIRYAYIPDSGRFQECPLKGEAESKEEGIEW